MSGYLESHPWLKFKIDLRRFPWEFWLLAGEAVSKCTHIRGVALDPETAKKLMQVYLAKGALATTAIEGNTLTEEEAQRRVAGALTLPPSREYLGVEIDNIVAGCAEIVKRSSAATRPPITPAFIAGLNARVLQGLPLEEHVVPGSLRPYSVGVADYRGAPPSDVPELMRKLCAWLEEPWISSVKWLADQDRECLEGLLKAVAGHLYIAWIHPFGDGNGRTARLLEFAILVSAGVPLPAAHLLSNHYNETRSEYYRHLRYASKSGGDVAQFCAYAVRGFVDQLQEQIATIREYQLDLFWQQHLLEVLGDSETGRRRRYLVLDIGQLGQPVPRNKLAEVSPRVLRHYSRFSEKTLTRDVEQLASQGLILFVEGGYVANRQFVMAYMPPYQAVRA